MEYGYTRAVLKDYPPAAGPQQDVRACGAGDQGCIDATCYVCGPASFVETAASLLIACGQKPDRIRTERLGSRGEWK
jgi:hypothetical protein